MSASQAFRSIERVQDARLLSAPLESPLDPHPPAGDKLMLRPNRSNVHEFLIHGLKYVFPVQRGGPTRGVPTAEAAPPLNKEFGADFALPPVWPHATGPVRGIAFSPLYKNVPQAAMLDPRLYELLALVDAIREGRARERGVAIRELSTRLNIKSVTSP